MGHLAVTHLAKSEFVASRFAALAARRGDDTLGRSQNVLDANFRTSIPLPSTRMIGMKMDASNSTDQQLARGARAPIKFSGRRRSREASSNEDAQQSAGEVGSAAP